LDLNSGQLEEISLVRHAATTGIRPILWRSSDIATDPGQPSGLPLPWQGAWRRAHQVLSDVRWRLRPRPCLEVEDLGPKSTAHSPGDRGHDDVGGYIDGKPMTPRQFRMFRSMLDEGVPLDDVVRCVRAVA
jgi:hypothetical protein